MLEILSVVAQALWMVTKIVWIAILLYVGLAVFKEDLGKRRMKKWIDR